MIYRVLCFKPISRNVIFRIRQMLSENDELRAEIEKIKKKLDNQDKNLELVFQYLDKLIEHKTHIKERKRIGYKPDLS
jgi:hypothetical protein